MPHMVISAPARHDAIVPLLLPRAGKPATIPGLSPQARTVPLHHRAMYRFDTPAPPVRRAALARLRWQDGR